MSDTNDSRIEKLLKAILGQEVQLEPRESRVEDLLYAILTGGSYDEPTLSEMEDILLCILHGERYDGPTSSRINALLKVKANGGDYDEPRLSRIEELIYEWITGGDISIYTGTLPAALQTVAGYLLGYKVWGNTGGVGAETENLFDAATAYGNMYDSATGTLVGAASSLTTMRNKFDSSMVGVPITISIHADDVPVTRVYIRCTIGGTNVDSNSIANGKTGIMTVTVTPTSVNDDWRITFGTGAGDITLSDIMLNLGTTPLPYVPFGYKLPILSNDTITDIYIGDTQLAKDEYVDSSSRQIYKRTENLLNETWFNDDKQLSASSGLPVNYTGRIAIINPIDVSNIDAVTLTYSLGTTATEYFMYSIFSGNTLIERVANKTSGATINVTNADTLYICLYIGGRNITVNDVQWIMLNLGSEALPYEPYLTPTEPPAPLPQIPTFAGKTTISYGGTGAQPEKVELKYR